jgi:hypothetical protein
VVAPVLFLLEHAAATIKAMSNKPTTRRPVERDETEFDTVPPGMLIPQGGVGT